jgi:N-acetylglutamate synthase-like GNAT family acetyltransferase
MMQLCDKSFDIRLHEGIPDEARGLIWNVFFASRQRGVSLEYHFPWINSKDSVTCITVEQKINDHAEVVGTLVVKREQIEPIGLVGLIGLVCVKVNHRGQGLSIRLMRTAVEYSLAASLKALILWTTKPDLYKKMGFSEDSIDYFGIVKRKAPTLSTTTEANKQRGIKVEDIHQLGVPAFAKNALKYTYCAESITVCHTALGYLLAEWSGKNEGIDFLIENVLPDSWTIISSKESKLIPVLQRNGYSVELQTSTKRMTKILASHELMCIPYIGILSRI